MTRIVGWKTGKPEHSEPVKVLRQLSNGQRVTWTCRYSHYSWDWVTLDGVIIGGILGWRELP